ncbi:MAG: hypothetical protein PF488_02280 [Patescibacteria group bacterium]|jgi:NADPH-dependent 7-cyano-7-deazaguanine reductase QueF-like protein|nr:hypothetical protein [Patescibacteria group bacterium]
MNIEQLEQYKKDLKISIDKINREEVEMIFLNSSSLNGYGHFDVEEMNLELLNTKKLKRYLNRFDNKRLEKLIKSIL